MHHQAQPVTQYIPRAERVETSRPQWQQACLASVRHRASSEEGKGRKERQARREGRLRKRRKEGEGVVGTQIHRRGGSVMAQRCESMNGLMPSFLRLDRMWAGDAAMVTAVSPAHI